MELENPNIIFLYYSQSSSLHDLVTTGLGNCPWTES